VSTSLYEYKNIILILVKKTPLVTNIEYSFHTKLYWNHQEQPVD